MMRARPSARLAETERPVPALRGRAGGRLVVRRARRRLHPIALRVRVAGTLPERTVGLLRQGQPRQIPGDPVDRYLTPAVPADGDLHRRLRGENGWCQIAVNG